MRRIRPHLVLCAVILLALLAPHLDARPSSRHALNGDVPDPAFLRADGDLYAYSTNAGVFGSVHNVPTYRWTATTGWTVLDDALPALGPWSEPGRVWAPGVIGVDGGYALYYSSQVRGWSGQCIGMALADDPAGPFTDPGVFPFVCQTSRGGSIDASPFRSSDGSLWLSWKSEDNAAGRPSVLWTARLSSDGRNLISDPAAVLQADRSWESGIIENPEFVEASGRLWLAYSGNRWETAAYGIGWASCATPVGPCTKLTTSGPWLGAQHGPAGPGAGTIEIIDGTAQLGYHAWTGAVGYGSGGRRSLFTEPIGFTSAGPELRSDLAPVGRPDDRRLWTRAEILGGLDQMRYGAGGGRLLACDLDGDGVSTPVTFRGGRWWRSDVAATSSSAIIGYGRPTDTPLCADFDGDGDDDLSVYRDGVFHFRSGVGSGSVRFGRAGDVPLLGDFDGDGRADLGVRRGPAFLLRTDRNGGSAQLTYTFGRAGDVPVVGDWNGDGVDHPGIYRDGTFHLQPRHAGGTAPIVVPLGEAGHAPVVGNWDGRLGDGVAAVAP